ncbi:hypothetical protein CRUP_037242 [Coryphaenoides rupestris]|nr:hypothetical protein CRUP_037242 [Coryphaenoides rupestris]
MYTGGVSSLAEQIANQLQSHSEPKPLLDKRDPGSLRKEFPVTMGGSDVCFFCHKRVYVMERLSAEGRFFHRSCFKCDYCSTTLRLSSYAFHVEGGGPTGSFRPGPEEEAGPLPPPPQSSGTPLSPVAVATRPGHPALAASLGTSLRRTLSWSCHQVAHQPLDSLFLRAYCIYLICCVTLNALLRLL